jgi:hypothetical protein
VGSCRSAPRQVTLQVCHLAVVPPTRNIKVPSSSASSMVEVITDRSSPFSGVKLRRMDHSPRHQRALPSQRNIAAFVHHTGTDDSSARKLRPLSTLLRTSSFTTTDYGWLDDCGLGGTSSQPAMSQSACDLRSSSQATTNEGERPPSTRTEEEHVTALSTIPEVTELVDATREIENICEYFGHVVNERKTSVNSGKGRAEVQHEFDKENYSRVVEKDRTRNSSQQKSYGGRTTQPLTTLKYRDMPSAVSAQSTNVIQPISPSPSLVVKSKVNGAFQRSVTNRRSFSLPRLKKFGLKVNKIQYANDF